MVFLNKFLFFSLFQLSEKCFVGVSLQPTSLYVPIWFNLVFFFSFLSVSIFVFCGDLLSISSSSQNTVFRRRESERLRGPSRVGYPFSESMTHTVITLKDNLFAIPRDLFRSF